VVTTDISQFGYIERKEAAMLLTAHQTENDDTEFFDSEGIHIMFNTQSGYVFLTNDNFQVAMMAGEKLVDFLTCPNCGNEGFKEEVNSGEPCCKEYIKELES
jgi:hypothetical protein